MIYFIRFIEKSINKRGSLTRDSETRIINDITNENEVRRAITESFVLSVNILNAGIKEVIFNISDYNNQSIWSGEGTVIENELKISVLKDEK